MADKETIIGPETRVSGELRGDEDVVVRGRVDGRVLLNATFTVEESAIIQADVEARIILISGVVVGNLTALESIRLAQRARVVGDIIAPRVIMEEGATYKGRLDMGQSAEASDAQARTAARRSEDEEPGRASPPRLSVPPRVTEAPPRVSEARISEARISEARIGERQRGPDQRGPTADDRFSSGAGGGSAAHAPAPGRGSAIAAGAGRSGRRRRRVGSRLGQEEASPAHLIAPLAQIVRPPRPTTRATTYCNVSRVEIEAHLVRVWYLPHAHVRRLWHLRSPRGGQPRLSRPARSPASGAGVRGHRRQRRRIPPAHPGDGAVAGTSSPPIDSSRLAGPAAIGHVRYSTAGARASRTPSPSPSSTPAARWRWPTTATSSTRASCARALEDEGAIFQSTSDTEVIIHLIARSRQKSLPDRARRGPARGTGRLLTGLAVPHRC